jgi:diaminopimelate epimerase
VAAAAGAGGSFVTEVPFYKMTGSGNDFVMLDGRRTRADEWPGELIRAICDRRNGVGADGLVILTPADRGAVRMQYWNADGSRAAMCGNAALCSGRLARRLAMVSFDEFDLLTDTGRVQLRTLPEGEQAEVKLPDVLLPPKPVPEISPSAGECWMSFLTVGVPHLVIRVEDVDEVDPAVRGRMLRSHPALGPGGANVNFISRSSERDSPWLIRTYERGVEQETLACGTGTVAAAIALAVHQEDGLPLRFRSRGGLPLVVRSDLLGSSATNVWLQGEGRMIFQGTWLRSPNLLQGKTLPT